MTRGTVRNVYIGKEDEAHRWSFPVFILVLIGILALLGLSHVWRSGLKAREFVVAGNSILSEEEILNLAAIPRPIGMFELDLMDIKRRIEKHAYVKEAIVSRDLPSRIRIHVRERSPVAILAGPQPLLIGADLVLLPTTPSSEMYDLPIVTGWRSKTAIESRDEASGIPTHWTPSKLHRDFRRALEIIEISKRIDEDLYQLLSEVRLLDDGDVILYSSDFGVPIVFGRGDVARKLVYLHEFWEQVVAREGAGKLQSVDLRFEGQIVARWNQQSQKHGTRKSPAL